MERLVGRLGEYIRSLPDGLDSYPECQTKSSVAMSALEGQNAESLAEGLPEVLANLILNPPPVGVWIPATCSDAIFHLVCEKQYPTESLMREWCYRRTMAVAGHPIYRALLRVSGPRVFFSLSARTHGLFQRGTLFELLENGSHRMVARLTFPPRLHNRFNLLSNVPLFAGVAELTGGKDVACRMLDHSETSADYECSWS